MPSGIRAIKAGALDFLIHPVEPQELCCGVEEAFRRHRISRQRQGEFAAPKARYGSLTRREREVFALIYYHFKNKSSLFDGVFERRARPLVAARRDSLTAYMGHGGPVTVEVAVAAFINPMIDLSLHGAPRQPKEGALLGL
jgi:FixJ family two-component response regulator